MTDRFLSLKVRKLFFIKARKILLNAQHINGVDLWQHYEITDNCAR